MTNTPITRDTPGKQQLCRSCRRLLDRFQDFYPIKRSGMISGYRAVCKDCYKKHQLTIYYDSAWATQDNTPVTIVEMFSGLRVARDTKLIGTCILCHLIAPIRHRQLKPLLTLEKSERLPDGRIPFLCSHCLPTWRKERHRGPKENTDTPLYYYLSKIVGLEDNNNHEH